MNAIHTFKEKFRALLATMHDLTKKWLGSAYEVTVILHNEEGRPSDSVVASTGNQTNALPALADAASDKVSMIET